jgi:hypothetical protein
MPQERREGGNEGTWERGNVGTRERGNVGTWEGGNEERRERGSEGTSLKEGERSRNV